MDFGLVGPDGVFHYVSAEDGSFDKIFRDSGARGLQAGN